MTSAHRPTWKAAVGGNEQGGNVLYIPSRQYSSRDMPSHQKLKLRQEGQGTTEEAKKINFRQNVLEREAGHIKGKIMGGEEEFIGEAIREEPEEKYSLDNAVGLMREKRRKIEPEVNPFPQDADVGLSEADEEFEREENGGKENDGDQLSDDENAELMREFEKIKKDREEEQKRKVIGRFLRK